MQQIAPNVYIEDTYHLVTVGAILTGEGWVCVDTPPLPNEARAWRQTLFEISPVPFRYIVNTDHHRDRVIGNAWFDAPVVTHKVCADALLEMEHNIISQAAVELSFSDGERMLISGTKPALPQITFSDSLHLIGDDYDIELVNKPSASLGSLWVILKKQRVIFTGDSIVVGQHPYIHDGASKNWLDILRLLRLERYDGWQIVSGRDGLIDRAATAPLSDYLRTARRRVTSLYRADRSRSEIGQLVPEFMEMFPYPPGSREQAQRRIRAGLEAIYEELRSLPGEAEKEV
jgi:glyoxylase-like metal-dependent hydrolase (beta-lactamase superfamily II)